MKKISLIALAVIPTMGMVSCSDKEEAPAAAAEKALTTAEDYMNAGADVMTELGDILDATTVENSAEQAKKIQALTAKMAQLMKEVEEKGFAEAEPTGEIAARMEAAENRLGQWFLKNAENMEKFAPSFLEAVQNFGK